MQDCRPGNGGKQGNSLFDGMSDLALLGCCLVHLHFQFSATCCLRPQYVPTIMTEGIWGLEIQMCRRHLWKPSCLPSFSQADYQLAGKPDREGKEGLFKWLLGPSEPQATNGEDVACKSLHTGVSRNLFDLKPKCAFIIDLMRVALMTLLALK